MKLTLLLSILSLLLSIFLFFNRIRSPFYRLLITTFAVLSFVLIAGYHVSDILTNNGFDESVFFHIKMGLHGADLADFWQIILYGIFLFFIVVLMSSYIYRKMHTELPNKNNFIIVFSAIGLLFYSILSNPIIDNLRTFFVYDNDQKFYDYYRVPQISSHEKRSKKNIVYIYAESLERTYFDEILFPGLIEGLREIEKKSISFDNIFQVYATGWTIAGMTASQCAIPLITPSGGNSMSGIENNFLPGIKCLGDLLNDSGYLLEYFGGSSLEFAGKGNFYRSHGFSKVMGKKEMTPLLSNPSYLTGWGLYDDTLLDIVYKEFEILSKKQKPFGLFTLTLDTHHPIGHSSQTCIDNNIIYRNGDNSMLNAVKCSDYLLTKFINDILSSAYAKDTLIVLSSDHLAMPNDASDLLEEGKRRNLFMVIDGAQEYQAKTITNRGSMLDVAPTIMSILGFQGEIGLGRNLLNESSLINISNRADILLKENSDLCNTLTNTQLFGLNVLNINQMLSSWRTNLLDFWSFPTIIQDMKIDFQSKKIYIGNQVFKYPIVLKLDDKEGLMPRFNFDERGTLKDQTSKIPIQNSFIWIDKCYYMNSTINVKNPVDEICFAVGNKQNDLLYVRKILGDVNISSETLETLTNDGIVEENADFIKMQYSSVASALDLNKKYSERCHSTNMHPEDIMRKYLSDDTVFLLSGYHIRMELISDEFKNYMQELNSSFTSLDFSDLYLGIIENNQLIVEKIGKEDIINVNYNISNYNINIKTEGLTKLHKSSININGVELSPNYNSLNLVVLNKKTGDALFYNFPTYKVWLPEDK